MLALAYGDVTSASAPAAARKTYLLDERGVLVLEYTSNIVVGEHPDHVLEDCRALFGR